MKRSLFDSVDLKEYEANIFASELLLTDDAESVLCVPAEMLDFKFRVMKRKGYKPESPIASHGDFPKNIERGWSASSGE